MKKWFVLISVIAVLIVLAPVAIVIIMGLIKSINHPPTADANSVTIAEDTSIPIVLKGEDRDGDTLTYSVVAEPSHGRLSGTAPNLTYSPNENFAGPDSFTFTINDGEDESALATVSIMVTPVNDLPTANKDKATAQEDAPIVMIDVLANDTDADGDRLMVVNATQGRNGSVTINTDGTLTYVPAKNFCGSDTFSYTMSDGKGGTGTATVEVIVNAVNDPPRITSRPVETTRVWAPYTYDVEAKDPDLQDKLVYSLTARPDGMTIDPTTGLIEWRPTSAQAGTYDVLIKVVDSNNIPATATQSFTLTVTSLTSPLTANLTVVDCYSRGGGENVSLRDKIDLVRTSDGNQLVTRPRSNTCYDFSDASIPTGAKVKSVVIHVEHFEDVGFQEGKLEWLAGANFSAEPEVWVSVAAPVRLGQAGKAMDSWDITSAVETPEKANSLQVQILNNDPSGRRNTSIDLIYAVVEWY